VVDSVVLSTTWQNHIKTLNITHRLPCIEYKAIFSMNIVIVWTLYDHFLRSYLYPKNNIINVKHRIFRSIFIWYQNIGTYCYVFTENNNRLLVNLLHLRADKIDLYWLRYVYSHSISVDNHFTTDQSHFLDGENSSKTIRATLI
jgi:hypothetical protein